MTHLLQSKNDIGDTGARCLGEALKSNGILQILKLVSVASWLSSCFEICVFSSNPLRAEQDSRWKLGLVRSGRGSKIERYPEETGFGARFVHAKHTCFDLWGAEW